MRPDYQPEMESGPINIRLVLFYDTVVLGNDLAQDSQRKIAPIFLKVGDEHV
jgi:hypothetical protein